MRKIIDRALPFIVVVALFAVVLANPDPLARNALCSSYAICFSSANSAFWNGLFYDVGLGAIVSTVFYWLLIKLPDYSKRKRIRTYLAASYKAVRREVVLQMLHAADRGPASYDLVIELIPQMQFRQHFNQPSRLVKGDKWHDVMNNISEFELREIAAVLNLLKDDLHYVLNNVDDFDQKSFNILQFTIKAISVADFKSEAYDDRKLLFSFLWQMMAGWDPITGYLNQDPIQHVIDGI